MKPILLIIFLSLPSLTFSQKRESGTHLLATWMAGQFDNQSQSQATQGYFDLHVNTVQIWKGRRDGYWLYTEEAGADHLNMPHRQRVYRYHGTDSTLIREEFLIPEARQYAGAYKFKRPLDDLSPEVLSKREGCDVYFSYDSGRFIGRTSGFACPSEIGGVAYSMTELVIASERLTTWDRGFIDREEVVWGAVAPYEFSKKVTFDVSKVKLKSDWNLPLKVIPVLDSLPAAQAPLPVDSLPAVQAPLPAKVDLKVLVSFMAGHFETKNQTADGEIFRDVQLDIVPVWNKKKDGYWLYVEEARANQKEVTYQQQVFHLYMLGNLFVQDTYEVGSPMRFDGPKKFKKTLKSLQKDSLILVAGCEIYFRYDSGKFRGQTNRVNCPTRVEGAASGYREFQVKATEMEFTEHGFDAAGVPIVAKLGPFIYYRRPRKE